MRTKLDSAGMTLVELMVALGITSIVMMLSLSIFSGQIRSYNFSLETKEALETNQDIIEILRRDLAQAGWAVRSEMSFFFEDGGANNSDKIYLSDASIIDLDFAKPNDLKLLTLGDTADCAGCVTIESGSSSDTVVVSKLDIDDADDNGSASGIDFIAGANQFVLSDSTSNKIAKVGSITTGLRQLNLDRAIDGNQLSPAIYYCIDDGTDASNCHISGTTHKWVLRRSDIATGGGMKQLSSNVVDMQVAYRDRQGNWYGLPGCANSGIGANTYCSRSPFEASEITLIRLTLLTRSEDDIAKNDTDAKYCRPAAENRLAATAGSNECGYIYRARTVTIQPRNIRP